MIDKDLNRINAPSDFSYRPTKRARCSSRKSLIWLASHKLPDPCTKGTMWNFSRKQSYVGGCKILFLQAHAPTGIQSSIFKGTSALQPLLEEDRMGRYPVPSVSDHGQLETSFPNVQLQKSYLNLINRLFSLKGISVHKMRSQARSSIALSSAIFWGQIEENGNSILKA